MNFNEHKSRFAAHRGGCSHLPENSLAAFEAAAKAGIGYIEMDVQMTADWKIVVSHDNRIKRMTGFDFDIDKMSYSKLRMYPLMHDKEATGQFIPRLKDALTVIEPSTSKILLEIKPPVERDEIEAKQLMIDAYKIVKEAGMLDRVIFMSVQSEATLNLRRMFPDVVVCYPGLGGNIDEDLQLAIDEKFDVFGCPRQKYSPKLNSIIQSAGLQSFVFVLEQFEDSERYIEDGVDIVMPKHVDPLLG